MNINSLSLLDKTMQVTPHVMRMLRRLLEREVPRDDPEWAVVMARLTVSEKVKKDHAVNAPTQGKRKGL